MVPRAIQIALIASAVGCLGDLELPEPPDLAPLEQQYETPTEELSAANAAGVIQQFIEDRERLAQIDDLETVVSTLVRLDEEVSVSAADGAVEIRGAPVQTDAVIEVTGACPGFEGQEPVDGFQLTVVVRRAELIPVAFGSIRSCRIEHELRGTVLQVELSGELSAYLPNILSQDGPRIIFMRYELTEITINDRAVPPWSDDFRIVDDRLELLVETAPGGTMVLFAAQGLEEIGVRAANGQWSCFPQERRCESLELPAFSY